MEEGHAKIALDAWLEHERPPDPSARCFHCDTELTKKLTTSAEEQPRGHSTDTNSRPSFYRCFDCHFMPDLCRSCLLIIHRLNPFHRLLSWDPVRAMWQRTTTANLGLVLYGGHGGRRCPRVSREPREMVIVHEGGVTKLRLSFCECRPIGLSGTRLRTAHATSECIAEDLSRDLLVPEPIQLIQMGLYPASWKRPRTAFTMKLMRAYHLLSLQAQTSALDFYNYLRRTTDNVDPESVPDRYREMLASMREFSFLRACKRAGQIPGRNMPPRSLAVLCPACPQPAMNMRPGWTARAHKYSYLDALFYGIDGNYHQHQRKKATDKDDIPLTMGAAYYANEADFETYVKAMGEPTPEDSTCHKFGATGSGGYTHNVSGVLALSCRHQFLLPASCVDLISNEKAYIVDFAVVSGAQPYLSLRLFKQFYDVSCQYMVRFKLRLGRMEGHIPLLDSLSTARLPRVEGAIGSWHQYAHKEQCQAFQSPNCLPGCGKADGEMLERTWAVTNPLARRTKEMGRGHCHDIMNDQYSDMNVRHVHGIAKELVTKHTDAERFLGDAKRYLEKVESGIPDEILKQWIAEEAEWLTKVVDISNHKGLDNPFTSPKDDVMTKCGAVAKLASARRIDEHIIGMELVAAIEGMVDLEQERLDLIKLVYSTDGAKMKQRTTLHRKVQAFTAKASLCEDIYSRYVNPLVTLAYNSLVATASEGNTEQTSAMSLPSCLPWRDSADDRGCGVEPCPQTERDRPEDSFLAEMLDDIEEVDIYLPSLYHSTIRNHPHMVAVVAIERKIREGQAHEALNDLRLQLTARHSLQDLREQGSGQAHNKRITDMDKTYKEASNCARDEYRRIRCLLLILGMSPSHDSLRELKDEDCKPLVEIRRLGESRTTRSWLWGDMSMLRDEMDAEAKAFMISRTRPHWFRCRAAKARWEEEVYLKREEMYRTLRFFLHGREMWDKRAREHGGLRAWGAQAYANRSAYRYERLYNSARAIYPACIEKVSLPLRAYLSCP
ncbi:hypothetical protein C8Q76DRAFT_635860 [Earliella scabrosa]|nr:hypothetical protein C8Q76DRAFT_635860 [Earliella scabrosa]